MESTLSDMKIKSEQSERRNAEIRASEERKHNEEIVFLKKTNAQLKVNLIYFFLNLFSLIFFIFCCSLNSKESLHQKNKFNFDFILDVKIIKIGKNFFITLVVVLIM